MARLNKYDRQHAANVAYYQRLIDAIFEAATKEAAAIGSRVDFDPSRVFSFDDYPITQELVKNLLSRLGSGLEAAIVDGVRSEWTLANNKNDELARVVFGDNVGRLTQAQYRRYFSNNEDARQAFLQRKENGLNLSERVWRYADQFKSDIELGLDVGIRSGLDAPAMSRELQQYLQHPDMLFRRVRDEHGILQLSKRAAEYHPGQGVYRSSYKNARRLAATETNMAYHSADHERWKQLDFVVGIEIRLSGNHTCMGRDGKPHKFHDICDELQGRYPKDFKFTGWHPHCRCQAITILKTEKELMEENRAILRGEEPSTESVNAVTDVPDNFKKWLEDNKERAKTHFTMPYFIKDNLDYVPFKVLKYYGSRVPYETFAEYEAAMRFNRKNAKFSEEIKKNIKELNEVMPVLQGKVMDIAEADKGNGNPMYNDEDALENGYRHNCQTCTMVYEARRRGFNVKAKPNPKSGTERDFDTFCKGKKIVWTDRFLNADGTKAEYTWSRSKVTKDTNAAKREFIEGCITETGRYEVYCIWKGKGDIAHVFIIERQANGNLMWFDPQTGEAGKDVEKYLKKMRMASIGVMRVDDKLINPKFAERFIKS